MNDETSIGVRGKLLLLFVSLLVGLGVAEVTLRLIGFSYPPFFVADTLLGAKHRPGAEGVYREEGRAYVRINRAGMRADRDFSLEKPRGTLRIAVLGDSYPEAFQLPADSTFWAVLQRGLTTCHAGQSVEALNFGVSGYNTLQELLQLRSQVWSYDPDIVLLAFLSGNDVRDHSRGLAGYPRPYPVLAGDSVLVDNSFRKSRAFRIKSSGPWRLFVGAADRLRLAQLLRRAMYYAAQPAGPAADNGRTPELGLDMQIYAAPGDSTWTNGWAATERLILMMRREVEQKGARFVVLGLSNGDQVHPDSVHRASVAQQLGVPDLWYPERRLQALADSARIEYVPVAPTMAQIAQREKLFLHGFPNLNPGGGHWNEAGHRVAGELATAYLCGSWRPDRVK